MSWSLHRSSLPTTVSPVTTKQRSNFPTGRADRVVIKDLVVGDGAEAVPGGTVEVNYVGVEYDTATNSTDRESRRVPSSSVARANQGLGGRHPPA